MKKYLIFLFVVGFLFSSLSGCHPPPRDNQPKPVKAVKPPPPPCPGARWIPGAYNARGVWIEGHWECPSPPPQEPVG